LDVGGNKGCPPGEQVEKVGSIIIGGGGGGGGGGEKCGSFWTPIEKEGRTGTQISERRWFSEF